MSVHRLCKHNGCSRLRAEGSFYCEKHKEADEARDKELAEERAKKRFEHCKPSIYADLYQTARWKKESKEFIDKTGRRCEICGRTDLRLQVHHNYPKYYDYTNEFFDQSHWLVLCASCHERLTHGKDLTIPADHINKIRFDFRK